MSTPVLFLDDASRHTGTVDRATAESTAMKLLATLRRLRKINRRIALNAARPIAQYQIADNWTLQSVLGGSSYREEWDFVKALSDRSPFSEGLNESISDEIEKMEFRTLPGEVPSFALAWAMVLESATVSFCAHPDWAAPWVDTTYCKLDDTANLIHAEIRVKNASQAGHADQHESWLKRLGLSSVPSAAKLWSEKGDRFPGLRFLPRVERDLMALDGTGAPFLQAMASLADLSHDVANWKKDSAWPEFSTKATPESSQRQNLCWVHDEATGRKELFDWHTRFTGGWAGRVHFRVDIASRQIVVAYVGGKLTRDIPG